MKLAEMMAEEPEGYEEKPQESFAVLRERFLKGSDEEASDAFKGLMALCEEEENEEGEKTNPGLKVIIGD